MTGEIPLAADAVAVVVADTVDTARAGEKAGAKITMPASIIELRRRLDPLLCNSLDAHRRGAGLCTNDGNHEYDLEVCLAST
mmetsp:Transcript_3347/g.6132  ORF Transcript_3347/g.6132 Transcript_3347/m.6132 type:complete len:82 (+) Transcript_3347:389-634(+)